MNSRKLSITLMLAAGICLTVLSPALAQIGPQQPDAKPETHQSPGEFAKNVQGSLKKLFTPQPSADDQAKDTAKSPDDSDNGDDAAAADSTPKPQPKPFQRPPLISQPAEPMASIDDPQMDQKNPPIVKVRLVDPNNPLGLTDATNRLDTIDKLITQNHIEEARTQLPSLQQWLVDCTEAHINLYKTLNKLPSARTQAELERQLALEFALLRDRAIFLDGKIDVADKNYKQAVKQFIQVVQSEPQSKIGIQAYEALQDIGFTEKLHLAN